LIRFSEENVLVANILSVLFLKNKIFFDSSQEYLEFRGVLIIFFDNYNFNPRDLLKLYLKGTEQEMGARRLEIYF
jgi:hypothetical protein